jgi:hypothetical protein
MLGIAKSISIKKPLVRGAYAACSLKCEKLRKYSVAFEASDAAVRIAFGARPIQGSAHL